MNKQACPCLVMLYQHSHVVSSDMLVHPCRQLWHMQLDSSRNYIMLENLWISVGAISVMITTLLPAFFGMNLGAF